MKFINPSSCVLSPGDLVTMNASCGDTYGIPGGTVGTVVSRENVNGFIKVLWPQWGGKIQRATVNKVITAADYEIGDTVMQKTFDGSVRNVIVENKEVDIKNGRSGFTGTIVGSLPDAFDVWGYDYQIVGVTG